MSRDLPTERPTRDHGDTAETRVAVALLQRPERLAELTAVQPAWFALPECAAALTLAREYHLASAKAGRVRYATPEALLRLARRWADNAKRSSLTDDGKAEVRRRASVVEALSHLAADAVAWAPLDDHEFREAIDTVRAAAADERARRGILDLVDRFQQSGVRGLYDELSRLTGEIGAYAVSDAVGTLRTDARAAFLEYQARKSAPATGRWATFSPRLDALTTGGRAGRLWIVGGFAKDGKTLVSANLVYRACFEQNAGALIVTSEQTRDDVRNLLLVRHTHKFIRGGIDARKLDAAKLSPDEEAAYLNTVQDVQRGGYGPISYWQAPGGTTMRDVRAVLEAVSRRHPVDVLMLDHTMLFQPSVRIGSEVGDLSAVIREAKQIALDANGGRGLWLIAPHQINRQGWERAQQRGYYVPTDFGGSAEVERSADVLSWVFRDDELRDAGEVRFGVSLNRHGDIAPRGWQLHERYTRCAVLPMADEAALAAGAAGTNTPP